MRTPPDPLFDKEGEAAQPQGAFEIEVQDTSCTGELGVSPRFFIKVPQRMGDYQGVRILFPPFKGDSRG